MSSINEEITTSVVCFSFAAFIWYFNRTMLSKKCFEEQGECKKDKNERWLYKWLFVNRGLKPSAQSVFFNFEISFFKFSFSLSLRFPHLFLKGTYVIRVTSNHL